MKREVDMSKLIWNPDPITLDRINNVDYYISFKAFRRSSTSYVNKKYVRAYVFNSFNNECLFCKSKKELQVDHVISVHECFLRKRFSYCNSIKNLQLLCSSCNLLKSNKNV